LCLSLNAQIKEQYTSLKTYAFSDPDPIPILKSNPKIYPYHKFEGYEQEGKPQDWKTIHLENDFIELWVLPEVGGKLWGAREKSTGEEFIYRNEVMKFRNIAMRGPWTSGGIEFNFGVIGHTPATATPVDYILEENEDGSLSCVVGAMDLPSRTQWRVRIRLPKDKAYFETEALWYNPTPQHQAYYNWMTAAAAATEDLQFFCPGDQYVKHSGEVRPYPMEYGRNISNYKENDFTGSKSYHVVGEYNDFFGGYFKEQDYGFGHWSRYDEMPGQKLWIWALSRAGGIWEDLLTDTDGQYIEFQAGRLFDQYFPGETNPISQATFSPHTSDQWTELWFPVKGIGGLTDVSPQGILHLKATKEQLSFGINSLTKANGTLKIYTNDIVTYEKALDLQPMSVFQDSITWNATENWRIEVPEMNLQYSSNPKERLIERPFSPSKITEIPLFEQHFRAGLEAKEYRDYEKAEKELNACLGENPAHLEALAHFAELHYWKAEYDEGLKLVLEALALDTYHPQANYVAGILYKAKKNYLNAKEMLGWAARSMEYRSAAYALMAEIELAENELANAIHYGEKSLHFNQFNVAAHQVLIVAYRLNEKREQAKNYVQVLLKIDPLCHFARFEKHLLEDSDYQQFIRNEFPYQTYLEMAIIYHNMGQDAMAVKVLGDAPNHVLVDLWMAYLTNLPNRLENIAQRSIEFVFPYRSETLVPLKWAIGQSDNWKWKYYLGLNLWGKNRKSEAQYLLKIIDNQADEAVFYLSRATLSPNTKARDLKKALALDTDNWRSHQALIQHFQSENKHDLSLKVSQKAVQQFPDNYALALLHSKSLIHQEQYQAAIQQLQKTQVLPFEGAYEGRHLYEWAHYGYALKLMQKQQYAQAEKVLLAAKEWPENLGVGKPYDSDERMADYLLYQLYTKQKQTEKAIFFKDKVVEYTRRFPLQNKLIILLGLELMPATQRSNFVLQSYPVIEDLPKSLRWAVYQSIGNEEEAKSLQPEEVDISFRLIQEVLRGMKDER